MSKHLKEVRELTKYISVGREFRQRKQLDRRPQGENMLDTFEEAHVVGVE